MAVTSSLMELRKFLAPEIVFGPGAADLAGMYVRHLQARKVLVVTDSGVLHSGWVDKVCKSLNGDGVGYHVYAAISPNPREEEVMHGAELFAAQGCDAILAIGGGSPMDCAKGIGIVHTNGMHILEFEGVDQVPVPGPPLIAVPTTAGTSADVSQFAIISDQSRKVKIAIVSKTMVPDAALIDPVLTTTMDAELTACTGLDALTHAVEAYVSNASSPITDLFALSAMRRIFGNLERVIAAPQDLEGRSEMLQGSLEAGLAFSNAILGAVHAMAHSLGGFLDLPHGACNAILLPHVMRFNLQAAEPRFRDMAEAMGLDLTGLSPREAGLAGIDAVDALKRRAGITKTLGQLGVTRDILPELAAKAVADPCMLTNPRPAGVKEVLALYEQAL